MEADGSMHFKNKLIKQSTIILVIQCISHVPHKVDRVNILCYDQEKHAILVGEYRLYFRRKYIHRKKYIDVLI